MALSDDLYDHATRVRHAEHTAPIVGWRGDFEWHEPVARTRAGGPTRARAATRAAHRRLAMVARRRDLVDRPGAGRPADRRSVDHGRRRAHVRPRRGPDVRDAAARRVSATFGVVFVVAEILCFISPTDTLAATADMLGFLFAVVGVWWMIEAALERGLNPLWWIGLVAGVLMAGLAFWTAGGSYTTDAYPLLVCAGLWALMQGITQITRAFAIRRAQGRVVAICSALERGAACRETARMGLTFSRAGRPGYAVAVGALAITAVTLVIAVLKPYLDPWSLTALYLVACPGRDRLGLLARGHRRRRFVSHVRVLLRAAHPQLRDRARRSDSATVRSRSPRRTS